MAPRPVWLFSIGPVGDPPGPAEEPADVAPLLASTGAAGHRLFAGKVDRRRLGLGERAILRMVKAPEGDYQPWPEILDWARGIGAMLAGPSNATPD